MSQDLREARNPRSEKIHDACLAWPTGRRPGDVTRSGAPCLPPKRSPRLPDSPASDPVPPARTSGIFVPKKGGSPPSPLVGSHRVSAVIIALEFQRCPQKKFSSSLIRANPDRYFRSLKSMSLKYSASASASASSAEPKVGVSASTPSSAASASVCGAAPVARSTRSRIVREAAGPR